MNSTPNANRLHIAIFGRRNSGKSSLINAISGQKTALVSEAAGTTTDPVYRPMELHPLGACVLIDTAGFDDVGELGRMRVERTREVLEKADIVMIVFSDEVTSFEREWVNVIKEKNVPVLAVVNKADKYDTAALAEAVEEEFGLKPVVVSAKAATGIRELEDRLARLVPEGFESESITGHLVHAGDTVLLVMPQDIQAPKGRLILPQVQTIRDLLDNGCIPVCVTADRMEEALAAMEHPPAFIITDSQVFGMVYDKKPEDSLLTSFSVLFARHKGDIEEYVKGAEKIQSLKEVDRVLIAEACTHKPLDGDIGRVKLPKMLRRKVGDRLQIDIVSGNDFPQDLTPYALVIHCGGCMFNRRFVMSRIVQAQRQGVPITNYGVAIASMTGILNKIKY